MTILTPRSEHVVQYARSLARSRANESVSALHLLYGVLRFGEGPAPGVLESHGLVGTDFTPSPLVIETPSEESLPYSDCGKKALSAAELVVSELNHSCIGVEHLLLGILRTPSADVSAMLRSKNIDSDEIVADVMKEL